MLSAKYKGESPHGKSRRKWENNIQINPRGTGL